MRLTLALLYATALVAVGLVLRRRARSRVAAYLADRRLGTGLVAATLAATTVGGSATVVLARFVHAHGLPGLWLDLPLVLALATFGVLLAGRVRATGRFSLPDVAGELYGRGFRRAVAGLVVVAEVAWFALLARASAPFFGALVGWEPSLSVAVVAVLFVAYTTLGGQLAVAWTDLFQLALVGVLGLIVPAVLVWGRTDGLAGLPDTLRHFPTGGDLDAVAVLGLVALTGLPGLVGGDVYSKALSARDEKAARRGALWASLLKLIAMGSVAVLALGAHLLLPDVPTGDDILVRTLDVALPEGLAALATVGFLAAMMSSADSVLLTAATVVDVDLLPPPRTEPAERLRVRLWLVGLGAAGTVLALVGESVVGLMKWAYTWFAAGAPLPILAGFAWPGRIPDWAATGALIAGGTVAVFTKLAGVARPEPVLLGLAAATVVLLVGAGWGAWSGSRGSEEA